MQNKTQNSGNLSPRRGQQQQVPDSINESSKDQKQNNKNWEEKRQQLELLLDHNITTIVMTIITIYALFGDDIRVLSTDKDGDPYFWGLNIFCMVAFTLEIIVSSLAKHGYLLSFFFWLDVISTLSILLDIGWFSQLIFENGDTSGAASAAQLARAGRASRIGTKAGRIVRIVRLIRLVKLYKHAQQALINEAEIDNNVEDGENPELRQAQSTQRGGNQKQNTKLQAQRSINDQPQQRQQTQDNQQSSNQNQSPKLQAQQSESGQAVQNQDNNTDFVLNQEREQKKSVGKLPPIQPLNKNESDVDGPSKPIALDRYKNDPLLQIQSGNDTERDKMNDDNIARVHPSNKLDKSNQKMRESPMRRQQTSVAVQQQLQQENQDQGVPKETKVGQRLSDLTTKRVITLVLSIMVSVPIFNTTTWRDATSSYDTGLGSIYTFKDNAALMQEAMDNYIEFHKDERAPIIYIEWEKPVNSCCVIYSKVQNNDLDDYNDLRTEDYTIYTHTVEGTTNDVIGFSVMDRRTDNFLNAILSLVRTLFVSIVLSVGAMSFSRDVEQLVLEPIENMVNKVQRIADNPLQAAQMEEKEAFVYQDLKKQKNYKEILKKKEEEKMETVILEKLIIKIGALLAVGFGEAGSEIIAKNMQKGGAVDPLIPGQKIMAIFGFCDIRNFTDATEVLQTGVMVFVNEIAEITHGCVDEFCGQSNKNIGDAFLLVWKYSSESYTKDSATGEVALKNEKHVQRYSDLPVLAFVKIMSYLAQSNKLIKYKNNEGLNARIPDYNKKGVRMGFGLHQGWGIEGAIGSEFKIDASYLSPNVNMASRLEAATKQFGTGLLISGALYSTLTENLQKELRHIDRVTVKGSIKPMDLYTADVYYDLLLKNKKPGGADRYDVSSFSQIQKKKKRVIDRIKRDKRKKETEEGTLSISKLFHSDQDLVLMRSIFQKEFFDLFSEGFQHYLGGRWSEALAIFKQTYVMYEKENFLDGCSQTLINVIESNNGKAPSDWDGFRALVEK